MSDSSEETASLDFLSEDDDELWEEETSTSSGDGGSSRDCNITDRYRKFLVYHPQEMEELNAQMQDP